MMCSYCILLLLLIFFFYVKPFESQFLPEGCYINTIFLTYLFTYSVIS